MDQLDWKNLFLSFEGRINRQPFWIGVIILFVANIVVSLILGDGIIAILIALAMIYPGLCVYIKRCHDRGKSGWWCLLLLIPIVGLIWAIVDLGIFEGTKGSNDYGPDPLGGAAADAFD